MIIKDTENKGYKGFDIELVQKFTKDMGVEVEFVPTDWKTLINGIPIGKYDMTTSASITPSRAKVAICGDPYIFFGTIPLDLAENVDKYRSWAEIVQLGITVAITSGTSFASQVKNFFKNATIKKVAPPCLRIPRSPCRHTDLSLARAMLNRFLCRRPIATSGAS